jgi:hypothetical protein
MNRPTALQECWDALEQGYRIICYNGDVLYRRPGGEYVYIPYPPASIVALPDTEISSPDRETLLAFILLRDAVIDHTSVPADAPAPSVVAGDIIEGTVNYSVEEN